MLLVIDTVDSRTIRLLRFIMSSDEADALVISNDPLHVTFLFLPLSQTTLLMCVDG